MGKRGSSPDRKQAQEINSSLELMENLFRGPEVLYRELNFDFQANFDFLPFVVVIRRYLHWG